MARKKPHFPRQVENEHASLKQDMGEIVKIVAEKVAPGDFDDWKLQLTWRLRDFRNHLLKYFELEEHGGFMTDVVEVAPQTSQRVKHLEREHTEIAQDIDTLLASLDGIKAQDATALKTFESGTMDLINTLYKHESTENEVIQAAYLQGYGGPA